MTQSGPSKNPKLQLEADEIRSEIAREEHRLKLLMGTKERIEVRLSELRAQLRELIESPPLAGSARGTGEKMSPREKLALFRSLFVGRTDVFPRYWENRRSGKKGYAPACANEWVRGVCEKPRVKCGECPNQAFPPVTDRVILDHLQGRHVVGVYPLLHDETCMFLAFDFDKGAWKDDVSALASTCRRLGLPFGVERSRSGKGAHLWLFFSAPVPAVAARKLGCFLLTETMGTRPELSMASYDRLFPNQDTMPRGGFGNLIAMPLQHAARKDGNTVFVDGEFEPYPDQWGFLAVLPKLEPNRVEALARHAAETAQVLGIHDPEDEDDALPWTRPRSPRKLGSPIKGPLPVRVRAVLCQQLFVEKEGVPPSLLNRIQRLAAFPNPQYYKLEAMRLSTALTPRVISCAEDIAGYCALPRGCVSSLSDLLGGHGIELALEDQRTEGDQLELEFQGDLTPVQTEALEALLSKDNGVFVAPPGTGKTVVGIAAIAKRGRSTLVLVHRTQLLDLWREQLRLFLGLKPKDIGQIGGGKRRPNGRLDVAMLQSLVRRGDVDDTVAGYGHVLVDECHHVPAVSFERVMREVRARYVTGLTATPRRRDGHQPILEFQVGPVRYAVDARSQAARRPFEHRLIVRETEFSLEGTEAPSIQELYGMLATDEPRNDLILDDVVQALEARRSPLVLTERREHLELFAARLEKLARNMVVLHGGMGAKGRREAAAKLASIPEGEERLLLATGRFVGEGFDDARLDTLFLALPVAWRGTLVQYAGRLHRRHRGKEDVRVYDYVDRRVPVLARMFEKRRKGYRAMGYAEEILPTSAEGQPVEPRVEYDEEVLRDLDGLRF